MEMKNCLCLITLLFVIVFSGHLYAQEVWSDEELWPDEEVWSDDAVWPDEEERSETGERSASDDWLDDDTDTLPPCPKCHKTQFDAIGTGMRYPDPPPG